MVAPILPLAAVHAALAEPFVNQNIGVGAVPIDGKWQFKTGDDPAWAQPQFDDSGWEQIGAYTTWGAQTHPGYTGFAWYRRHIVLTANPGAGHGIALFLPPVDDVVQVYWNGSEIGNVGSPPPHLYAYAVPRPVLIPLPANAQGPLSGVLAFRVWKAMPGSFDPETMGGLSATPRIGDSASVGDMLTAEWYRRLHERLISWVITLLDSLMMLACLVAWLRDRRQWLFFWISLSYFDKLLGLVLADMQLPISSVWGYGILQPFISLADVSLWFILLWLFGLNRNRRWLGVTWTISIISLAAGTLDSLVLFFWVPLGQTGQLWDAVLTVVITAVELYAFVLLFAGLRRRQQTPTILVGVAAFLEQMFFVVRVASQQGVRYTHWTLNEKITQPIVSPLGMNVYVADLLQVLLLAALVYASWKYSTQQRQRRAAVEAEFKSAQEVQQILIPAIFETTPGLAIDSVYKPAAEVGGDFFQVIPLAGGDTLLVIGDVSGKGLRAAMTVSLIVGTLRTLAEQTGDPSKILAGLNRRLIGRVQDGFATAIAARLSPSGECVLANAGHPAPYLNGRELPHSGSLPLGIDAATVYPAQAVELGDADRLVFYTDGVIEARNLRGELYGFSRLESLLSNGATAAAITDSACNFGQDDDITVLVVRREALDHIEREAAANSVNLN
ncbi:MAG TPA: PP2C family protein-serine/threonine phosphatase [Acidisarcina sp.]